MSIHKSVPELPRYALEPDRLQKVLIAAAAAEAKLIAEVRQEMNHIAALSVREALRLDKAK
jgi:hypothetical protein